VARQRVIWQAPALRGSDEPSLSIWQRMEALLRAELPAVTGRGAASVSTSKLVLFVLVAFENQARGFAWPAVETIAGCSGLSTRAIYRAINQLVEQQLVQVVDRDTGEPTGTTWSSNRAYAIDWGRLWDLVPSRDAASPNRDAASQNRDAASQNRDAASPITSKQNKLSEQAIEQQTPDPDAWELEVRPLLLQLGVAPSRVIEVTKQCGSRERVDQILKQIRKAGRRIKDPAAYFCRYATRRDWSVSK
jgi:hypothetical protein